MLSQVNDLTDSEFTKWSDFVLSHPAGNFFHSPEYYKILFRMGIPVTALVKEDEKGITGILLAVSFSESIGIMNFLTKRVIIHGGPLVLDNNLEISNILLSRLMDLLKKKAIYIQVRNLFPMGELENSFIKCGFKFEDHLNYLIDLDETKEKLWKRVHSKRKNEIRKSQNSGVMVNEAGTVKELKESYRILQAVYERAKLPFPSEEFFRGTFEMYGSKIFKVFVARFGEKIIGTMYVLCYNYRIYDWYAGSLQEYYYLYPNDLITWEVIMWGNKNRYKIFDFGGAGKPGVKYGVRDFKRKFGGNQVCFGRYTRINNRILFNISNVGLKFWQLVKFRKVRLLN